MTVDNGHNQGLVEPAPESRRKAVTIQVRFYGVIRDVIGGTSVEVQLAEHSTTRDLLAVLHEKYGQGFADRVLDEKGDVRSYVRLFLNDDQLNDLDTILAENDSAAKMVIYVMPGSAGG